MEKFEEDLENLKNKINSMSLSDEFKENLSQKLDMEYDRISTKKRFFIPKQIVAACACCIVLTSCVFADSIGNVITNFFANTSKEMEQAIENGEIPYLDMDYVERDGVSIKVDYAMVKDNSIYLVFNVLSEEEIEVIKLLDYQIREKNGEIVFDSTDRNYYEIFTEYDIKLLDKKNLILFAKLDKVKDIGRLNEFDIELNKIIVGNVNDRKNLVNNWLFSIYIRE